MPTDYVEDYEEVTGLKREKFTEAAEAKVVEAPEKPKASRSTKAETKAK